MQLKQNFLSSFIVILILLIAPPANAQSQNDLIDHIIKEKFRIGSSQVFTNEDSPISKNGKAESKLTNNSAADEAEPFIIVNPNDSSHLLISYINLDLASEIFNFPIYYSNDSGQTWNKSSFDTQEFYLDDPFPGFEIAGGGDPIFAFDNDGNIYFTWLYLAANFSNFETRFVVLWGQSSDGGATWGIQEGDKKYLETGGLDLFTGGTNEFGTGVFDRPWFDSDRSGGPHDGNLYCTGLFIPSTTLAMDTTVEQTAGMVLKRKLPSVDSFETSRTQISNGDLAQFGNIKVANNGTIHVVYGNINDQEVRYSTSIDGGLSFEPPSTIGQFSFDIMSTIILVNDRENPALSMALDYSNNNTYIVWNSIDDRVSGLYTYSQDEGVTWKDVQDIATLSGMPDHQVYLPNIASNDNNEVSISWYSLDSLDVGNYMIMHSRDGGKNWETPISLSDAVTDFSEYIVTNPQQQPPIFGDYFTSVKVGCTTYSVWSDGRDMNGPKIYVSANNFCNVLSNTSEITAITEDIQLRSVYPNPSKHILYLEYNLKKQSDISVSIYNTDGKLVQSYLTESIPAGTQTRSYDIHSIIPAAYTILINSEFGTITRKIIKQ